MDQHLEPNEAAVIALGEPGVDARLLDHIEACAECRGEVDALHATVLVARSTVGEAKLVKPPDQVWQSIRGELGLSRDLMPPPMRVEATSDALGNAAESAPQPVPARELVHLDEVRERKSGIRRLIAPLVASAAAVALIASAAVVWNAGAPGDSGVVLASAQLDAFPDWSGATGEATVAELPDGERVVRVALDAEVQGDSVVREVWLLTESVDGLISLGLLDGPTGEFVVPATVDLARFSVVDISSEPVDGDPTHSGDSIVRGALGT